MNLTLLAAVAALADPTATAEDLSWMAGYWLDCDGKHVAESWTWLGGDALTGVGTTQGGDQTSFEFLRIAPNEDGVLTYYAMPGGAAPATPFAVTVADGQAVKFENPDNDFPQTIIYVRDGDTLYASIEGLSGDSYDGMAWTFQKAEAGETCAGG